MIIVCLHPSESKLQAGMTYVNIGYSYITRGETQGLGKYLLIRVEIINKRTKNDLEKQKYFILRNYMKVAPQSSKICANDEQKAPLILSASSVWVNSDCDNWKTLVPSFFSLNTV